MKLVIAVLSAADCGGLQDAFREQGVAFTRVRTAGGFLRETNATLLVGVEDARVDAVLGTIRARCARRMQPPIALMGADTLPADLPDVEVGGAVVFVLEVAHFERW